jgi:hypothetical protein
MSREALTHVPWSPANVRAKRSTADGRRSRGPDSGIAIWPTSTLSLQTSGAVREPGATMPILHLSAPSLYCTSPAALLDSANVPTRRLLLPRRRRQRHDPARFDHPGRGGRLEGSDRALDQGRNAERFDFLRARGMVLHPQDGSGVTRANQILVTSAAVEETIPDVQAARRIGAAITTRARLKAASRSSSTLPAVDALLVEPER